MELTLKNISENGPIKSCFPKNEYMRKKWLNVIGIDHCYDWQRICSDHFIDENYRPGKKRYLLPNTIPQPYDKNYNANGVPSNNITQNNDTETGNNEFLQMEQNHLREENIEIAVINNNESPRRRSHRKIRLTTTNEDISYENIPRLQTEQFDGQILTVNNDDNIQTDVVPDFTVGNGIRCSVKNCHNRHSKNLSFFGYPSDLTLRKIWIENCGLGVDPIEKIINKVRVCRVHFENDCFKNSEKKNRLRPEAVPTLFLGVDVIDTRNISSSSSHVNSGYIDANKPSWSFSNYIANVGSNQTSLMVYIDSTTRYAKDFEAYCSVPGCITNIDTYKEVEDISLFAPSKHCINEWSSILGLQLTVNSIVCERHFRPQDILKPELLVNGVSTKIKSLIPASLPVPNNAMQSSSNAMSETNTMLILRTYGDTLKRPKADEADEQLSKKIRNNVPDGTHQNISTSDLKPILSLNVSESIDNQPMFLKSISTTKTPYSSELPEIETPLISECISLASNSDNNSNTSECIIIDDDTEDCGLLFTDGTHQNISTSDLKPILSLNVSESIDNQPMFLKSISTTKTPYSSELPEIETPVISECISLASNSDNNSNTSECIIIDDDTEDCGLLFTYGTHQNISTSDLKPILSLNVSESIDNQPMFLKSISTTKTPYSSELPEIETPVISECISLAKNLLEKIDDIEECFGIDEFVHEKCIGYFEYTLEDIKMCSACHEMKNRCLQKINAILEFKSKTIESLKKKISERRARLLELKKKIQENRKKRISLRALKPSGITNIMKPRY
ncbi:hypothetical protein ACI65C_006334 [Semiaphis heraclei]